jgi:flagellar FliJ protein
MKFKFPFETLIKERKVRRDEAERDYRIALSKVEEQKAVQTQMKSALKDALNETQNIKKTGGMLASALVSYEEFVQGQKVKIQRHGKTIKGLEDIAEEKRKILVEAARDLKVLEKLKEKRYTQFKQEVRKKEMKLLDEIAITRAARGRME